MGGCILRIARCGELVGAASLIDPGVRKQNVAPVQVCPRAPWVRLDGSIVALHCFSIPALFFQCISFIDQCDCGASRVEWGAVVNRCKGPIHASPLEMPQG